MPRHPSLRKARCYKYLRNSIVVTVVQLIVRSFKVFNESQARHMTIGYGSDDFAN